MENTRKIIGRKAATRIRSPTKMQNSSQLCEEFRQCNPSIMCGYILSNNNIIPHALGKRKEKNMATFLLGKGVPFAVIFKDGTFILLSVEEYFAYKNGTRTNERAGFMYTVVDPVTFDKFKVKVPNQEQPVIQPADLAELRDSGEKVIVEFVNGIDKLYNRKVGNSWTVEDSFSAEDVLLVEEN